MNAITNLPEGMREAHGLYDPRNEHDACGIGLYANIHNKKSYEIVSKGLQILENLEHRGAVGADPKAGDGAGILIQIPHEFMAAEAKVLGFELPAAGQYGVGFLFMPREPLYRQDIERIWWETAREEGLKVLGWRDVPVDSSVLGYSVGQPFVMKHNLSANFLCAAKWFRIESWKCLAQKPAPIILYQFPAAPWFIKASFSALMLQTTILT
jgi:hypothetical protein